ncbi:MAG: cell division protein ZapA [Gemmatimonadota bacterium]
MTGDRESIKITILDEPFRLKPTADPGYTREVAAHVDRTLRGLRSSVPTLEPFQAAVLGAMEITDAMMQARKAGAEALEAALGRVRSLEADLDTALAETAAADGTKSRRKEKRAG